MFVISFSTAPKNVRRVLKLIDEQIAEMLFPTPEELAYTKEALVGSLVWTEDNITTRPLNMLAETFDRGAVINSDFAAQCIHEVTAKDVQRVVENTLIRTKPWITKVMPK